MLSFIKSNYSVGDTLEIVCSQGVIIGAIEYVTNSYIVLRQSNGQIVGIASADIRTFTAPNPIAFVPKEKPVTKAPFDEPTELPRNNENESDTATQSDNSEEQINQGELETYTSEAEIDVPTLPEPKVVGQIDLDSLHKIDPKLNRRRYFREDNAIGSDNSNNENNAFKNTHAWQAQSYGRQPYVPAKGRITYYNNEKRYGFIHDYTNDTSLYFYVQQISDRELYENLSKGTKVTYTIDRNAQGYIARCIHLPHTVSDLLYMAEEHLDAHRLQTAEAMVEHILEIYPENAEAKELLDQIHESTPQPRFTPKEQGASSTPYNLYVTYAQAKRAYLSKDYDEAENLYLKAINSGEKVESSVKDLLTLYVSLYKQATDEASQDEAYNKAEDFLKNYRSLLPDNLTTKQFLALNYYLPMQNFEHFIEIVDDILTDETVANVISRRVFFMWQKGIALNKLGHSEEALALAEAGLELAPHSRQLENLRDFILYPELHLTDNTTQSKEEKSSDSVSENSANKVTTSSPSLEEPDNNSKEEKQPKDDTTGTPQSDEWWDELKKPGLI